MNTLVELIESHLPLFVMAIVIALAILALVFWLGYRAGLVKAEQLMEYLVQLQKDRSYRRVIKMQAAKPKNSRMLSGYPYGCTSFSKKKALKNITHHQRSRRRN